MCTCERRFMSIVFNFITCVTLKFFYCRLFSMRVLCIFDEFDSRHQNQRLA